VSGHGHDLDGGSPERDRHGPDRHGHKRC